MGLASMAYLFAVGIIAVLPISAIALGLSRRSSDEAVRAARRVMKVQWFAGLVAIAFLR